MEAKYYSNWALWLPIRPTTNYYICSYKKIEMKKCKGYIKL